MHIIQLDHLTLNYAGRVIFRDLTWAVGDRDRVGLVGPNGSGKSSLLKLIMGQVHPDQGAVIRMRGISLGYLPQDVQLTPGRTVLSEAMILPPDLDQVEAELARIEAQLADPDVYQDSDALMRVLARQERALERYEALGGARHAGHVRDVLLRLGFQPDDFDLPVEVLSGGQKKLVALARLVVEAPDVLLLDEPDNHLDLAGKRRLETFLRGYNGAVVIVSHDRYLLDEVATQIAELAEGKLTVYPGNYTAYATERELRRLRQQQQYVAQQKEIARIEAAIKRFEHWASIVIDERHIRQARSRRKMLDRMEANGEIIERVTERRQMELQINGWRGSTKALEIERLSMAFGDDLLLLDLDLLVRHGERIGLVGPNGAGKSVLFRLILGELAPLSGEITIGPSTQIGYYAQQHETLTPWLDRSPLEMVRDIAPKSEGDAVAFLLKFLFTYEQTRQPIRTMSGGERSRLQLAGLMLQRPNLLLLDEPTNNLDIPSMEVLEQALDGFEGALLVISHDRYFLDQVVDRVIELDGGLLTAFEGGYTDYLAAVGEPV
ncbi:MAG: ABC-F family ATP-binding cassette domain-containing protein [Chloroflexi bacterium]|nr:ABC-F family ATP-binding cassette domain-containing protein [Chloroflexota bacterium]